MAKRKNQDIEADKIEEILEICANPALWEGEIEEQLEALTRYVQKNPLKAVGISLALGFLIGKLWGKSS